MRTTRKIIEEHIYWQRWGCIKEILKVHPEFKKEYGVWLI